MKKLLLIRHAKAVSEGDFPDFERPLKKSGLQDAENMAIRLKSYHIVPQAIISSPALRTLATANIFSEMMLLPEPLTNADIYDASQGTLLRIVNELPAQYDFAALVGHNPAISQLVYHLSGKMLDMPTCSVALIDFETVDWNTISMDTGNLVYHDEPDR